MYCVYVRNENALLFLDQLSKMGGFEVTTNLPANATNEIRMPEPMFSRKGTVPFVYIGTEISYGDSYWPGHLVQDWL